MPFMDHLKELRTRIVRGLLAVMVGFALCYAFSDAIMAWLLVPLRNAIDSLVAQGRLGQQDAPLHFRDPLEPFFAYLKLSMVAGLFVASPIVLYQIWAFIAPGLHAKERRVALPVVFLASLFFIGGGAFCYYVVLPYAMEFLIGYPLGEAGSPVGLSPLLMLDDYLARALQLVVAFAVVFELPLAVGILAWVGLVTPSMLWRWNRHVILGIIILAAVITPTGDPVNLAIMAIPMILLFELSAAFTWLLYRSRGNTAQ
jgi:sec-independent protein translocase protein TatC